MNMDTVVRIGSLLASIAIVNKQYTFVALTSGAAESKVIVPSGEGVLCIGVLLTEGTVAADKPCEIAIGGIAKVRGGATQNGGIRVKTDANGCAVAAGTGDVAMGIAIDNCVTADDLIRVLLISPFLAP